jgi:hypothetical protein
MWESSSNELRERDKQVDIKFGEDFLSMTKCEPTLFTINHPVGIVFDKLVKKITHSIGISSSNYPSSFFYNYLASNSWWPLYPEILDYHNLSYANSMLFKSPDNLKRKFYTLNQFVTASYMAYKDQNVDSSQLPQRLLNDFANI